MDAKCGIHSLCSNTESTTPLNVPVTVSHSEAPLVTRQPRSLLYGTGISTGGILQNSIVVFNEQPIEPKESCVFEEPLSISRIQRYREDPANAVTASLSLTTSSELGLGFADPCCPFKFEVTASLPLVCWESVARNLLLIIKLAGREFPAISLRAATSFEVRPTGDGVRVSIAPVWWSDAASFTIAGLYHAGQVVDTPLLPATITVVNINHAPSTKGRLWMSTKEGDISSVISAIKAGCSTEESDDEVNFLVHMS